MQTVVCQTAESFSPELTPQVQSLQKPRESESPRQSDFLSMLNESLRAQEPEAPSESAEQKPALAKAEEARPQNDAQESVQEKEAVKEDGKALQKDQPKKLAKKEEPQESQSPKIDAYIQGALGAKEPKKAPEKNVAKNSQKPGVKKISNESDSKKIDPKQLEFLRKISQKPAEKQSEGLKKFAAESAEGSKELSFPAESLLAGQKVVRDQADYTYVGQDKEDSKKSFDPKVSQAKKEKKPLIQVTDLRTKVDPAAQKDSSKDFKKNFVTSVKETEKGAVQMTLDLSSQAQKNILSLDGQSAASDGSTFQAMLKNQISQNAGDFVRAANIVLKDNNKGSIDLILHPEELGNVKISMEVHGKSIVGHITVASREAMEAFGQSADALKNSFLQSGFEDATFDVSFAGSQMQFAQGQAQDGADGKAGRGRKIYGEFTQESLTSVSDISDNFIDDDVSVNIVA
ncbi:MAG: flagellar hook-length control protein FliK [Treponema sp.]|nr:flagellar hook-length control protein FliK [Treponema sp.]